MRGGVDFSDEGPTGAEMNGTAQHVLLVVDDDEDMRNVIALDLRLEGFQVLTAASGEEAFDIIQKRPVDLVITDVRMPDGNGIELLNRIKDLDPFKPAVFFITGYTDMTEEEAYDWGASAMFLKPFNRKALQERVARFLLPKSAAWASSSVPVPSSMNLHLHFYSLDRSIKSRVLNIGQGGAFVGLSDHFPGLHEKIEFRIDFDADPGFPTISGTGLIRWVRHAAAGGLPAGCGVEFLYLDDESRKRVIELIRNARMKAFIPRN